MSKMYLMETGLTIVLACYLLKTKKDYSSSNEQETQEIFIKTIFIKLIFNMAWFLKILRIYLEKQCFGGLLIF